MRTEITDQLNISTHNGENADWIIEIPRSEAGFHTFLNAYDNRARLLQSRGNFQNFEEAVYENLQKIIFGRSAHKHLCVLDHRVGNIYTVSIEYGREMQDRIPALKLTRDMSQ